jgi:hypothetical protein
MSGQRDSWGFTEADHAELNSLLDRYDEDWLDTFMAIKNEIGTLAHGDDPGVAGDLARALPDGVTIRTFPHGGLWRELLTRLRARRAAEAP